MVTFNFKLTDAKVSYAGNTIVIDGPTGSHTVMNGVEKFAFTDGTVDNADGNALVDDLFYYAHNHDVRNAHIDADAHYATTGWKAGLDPSAFFDTSLYLQLNPAVKAAGLNPLDYFHNGGWQNSAAASTTFDAQQYLKVYTDVAAAHIDPLEHFLRWGASEGRQAFAPASAVTTNGFDYVYYLQNNPDVAAAGVDAFDHFQSFGWKEGRNPNALFDTAGYLAAYGDVKAAGINPLDHYHQFGWKEGVTRRSPSIARPILPPTRMSPPRRSIRCCTSSSSACTKAARPWPTAFEASLRSRAGALRACRVVVDNTASKMRTAVLTLR